MEIPLVILATIAIEGEHLRVRTARSRLTMWRRYRRSRQRSGRKTRIVAEEVDTFLVSSVVEQTQTPAKIGSKNVEKKKRKLLRPSEVKKRRWMRKTLYSSLGFVRRWRFVRISLTKMIQILLTMTTIATMVSVVAAQRRRQHHRRPWRFGADWCSPGPKSSRTGNVRMASL